MIIGYYSYIYLNEDEVKLDNLFLLPTYIGKGIGKLLMNDFLQRIKMTQRKKEIFTSFGRIKKNSQGQYEINPGAEELIGEYSAIENLASIYTPFTAKSSFRASNHQLNPKIIYRNLHIPMLIFDPISKNDWFNFKAENEKLTQQHKSYITHQIFENTWHGVKDERPKEVIEDFKQFLEFNKIVH